MKLRLHLVLSYKPIQCASKSNFLKSLWGNVYSGTIGEDFYVLLILMPCVTGCSLWQNVHPAERLIKC